MSTTSQSHRANRYNGQRRSLTPIKSGSPSAERRSRIRQRSKDITASRQHEDYIIDDLSSFVAEYSYDQVYQRDKPQPYQVLAANTGESDARGFGRPANKQSYVSNRRGPKNQRKAVEWRDNRRRSQNHDDSFEIRGSLTRDNSVQFRRSPTHGDSVNRRRSPDYEDSEYIKRSPTYEESYYSDHLKYRPKDNNNMTDEERVNIGDNHKKSKTSKRNKRQSPTRKSNDRQGRKVGGLKLFRKKPWTRSKSKSKSQVRSRSSQPKIRGRESRGVPPQLRKSKSVHSGRHRERRPDSRHRERRQDSDSECVKYIPLIYHSTKGEDRKHVRSVTPVERRRQPRPILKVMESELTETTPLITLHPQEKKDTAPSPYDYEFLSDSALPCKCFQCRRKYDELVKIKQRSEIKLKLKGCLEDECKPTRQPCKAPDWWYERPRPCPRVANQPYFTSCYFEREVNEPYFNPCYFADPRICTDPYNDPCTSCGDSWNQQERICCSNSVYWKFDSYHQTIDPNIKNYFRSILNKFYCY